MTRFGIPALALASTLFGMSMPAQGLDGDALQKALNDNAASFWIYDDLEAAYKKGRETGKPLLVSFRCVP